MTKIYFAKIKLLPSFFIANFDQKNQIIQDGFLSLSENEAKEWVKNKKEKFKVLSSRIYSLPYNKINSIFIKSEKFVSISIKIPGSLFDDYKEKNIYLDITDENLTSEFLSFAKDFVIRSEIKRQSSWKKSLKKTNTKRLE